MAVKCLVLYCKIVDFFKVIITNRQVTLRMSPLKSCLCQSARKSFQIVALNNIATANSACGYNELAINLELQDYKALRVCQPPVMDQYYSISLRYPHESTRNRETCNETHPYFWRTKESQKTQCVNGSPLKLPVSILKEPYCNVASVLPGSLDQIYNGNWTRCMSVQYCICQLETFDKITKRCTNVSKTTAITTPAPPPTTTNTTATTITTSTTSAKASQSNNNTAIIVGSVFGVFAVLLILLLLHLFRKRDKTKRNASHNKNQEDVCHK